jgi:hypothetical protein
MKLVLDIFYIKGILSQLIGLYNGQTNFDLRLITLDLSSQKLLFTDVLSPHYSIVIKLLIFYMNKGNVPLFILSLMHQLISWEMCEQRLELCPHTWYIKKPLSIEGCSGDLSTTQRWKSFWKYKHDFMYIKCMYFAVIAKN